MKKLGAQMLSASGLVALGVLGRLMPHLPNATPITAISLWGSAHLGRHLSLFIPIAAMLISDAVIGFYNWNILFSVYGSFVLIACIGRLLKKNSNPVAVALASVASSLLFFLITNFAVWLFSPWYAGNVAGLMYCYLLGIPFLGSMLLGDLLYTLLIFGVLNANFLSRGLVILGRTYVTLCHTHFSSNSNFASRGGFVRIVFNYSGRSSSKTNKPNNESKNKTSKNWRH